MIKRFRCGVIGGGSVLAMAVALLDPSSRTLTFLAASMALLVATFWLGELASGIKLLSIRLPTGLAVSVLSSCTYIILAELMLRIFWHQNFPEIKGRDNLGYRYDQKLGWFPIAGGSQPWTLRGRFTLRHNSAGFRGPERVSNGKPNMIFLGDSFVWGFDVDEPERFTEKLQKKHPDWNVYNLGIAGYGTDQEYLLLQQYFEQYAPRLVFLVFCVENDRTDNCINEKEGYFKPYYTTNAGLRLNGMPVPRSERSFCADHPAFCSSCLVRLGVRAWYNIRNPPYRSNNDPTTAIIRDMWKYVRAMGAHFAVGLTDREPELEQFLSASSIPYVDLSTSERFTPGDHWTAEGHTAIYEKIDKFLACLKIP